MGDGFSQILKIIDCVGRERGRVSDLYVFSLGSMVCVATHLCMLVALSTNRLLLTGILSPWKIAIIATRKLFVTLVWGCLKGAQKIFSL